MSTSGQDAKLFARVRWIFFYYCSLSTSPFLMELVVMLSTLQLSSKIPLYVCLTLTRTLETGLLLRSQYLDIDCNVNG